jgi:hypothetical protein
LFGQLAFPVAQLRYRCVVQLQGKYLNLVGGIFSVSKLKCGAL